MAELADAPDLGSGGNFRGGSNPPFRINNIRSVCMDYELKTNDSWNTTISLNISSEEFEREYQKVLGIYRKQVKLDGFRPGKAPVTLVEKKFKDDIEGEAINRIIPDKYEEIAKKEEIKPIARPVITQLNRETDKVTVEISVDVMPHITVKDYKEIDIDVKKNEITEDMVDGEIERIRKNYAKMEEIESPLEDGNVAIIDLNVMDSEGNEMEELAVKDYSVEIGTDKVYKEISEGLKGKSKGDKADVNFTYPEDFQNDELKGKQVTFKMDIKKTYTRILPEMNEEFAKNFGMNNMEQVKTAVKNNMENEAQRDYKLRKEEALFNYLIDKNPFNVPRTLVEAHMHSIMEGMGQKDMDKLDEKAREIYEPYAAWRAKRELILNAIIEQENIAVDDKEVNDELEKIKKSPNKEVRKYADDPEASDNIRTNMIFDKAMDMLNKAIKSPDAEHGNKKGDENASDTNGG